MQWMRIAITGSTGLIGSGLVQAFEARGDTVTRVVRSGARNPGTVQWDIAARRIDAGGLEGHDVVIHLAGESIAGVWTSEKKKRIRESREKGTRLLSETLVGLERKPSALLSASAFGIYGDRPRDEEVTEDSATGTGFLADVGRLWEEATAPAREAGIRVISMRFGNVLAAEGGMLDVLLPLFRLGLGGRLGSGEQVWPWIARDEIAPAALHALEAGLEGPVNFTSPHPVSNEEFTVALAEAVHRPAFFAVPRFAAKLAPGGMAEEMLLSGARVLPKRLVDSGYTFRWPELRAALRGILRRQG